MYIFIYSIYIYIYIYILYLHNSKPCQDVFKLQLVEKLFPCRFVPGGSSIAPLPTWCFDVTLASNPTKMANLELPFHPWNFHLDSQLASFLFSTRPEVSQQKLWKMGWLEDKPFLLGRELFRGELVNFWGQTLMLIVLKQIDWNAVKI